MRYYLKTGFIAYILISYLFLMGVPVAGAVLNVEDEIVMSLMVKNSTSPAELRLCLKLFPNSPFRATFEKRLLKIETKNMSSAERKEYIQQKRNIYEEGSDISLTLEDEYTMSRLVEQSNRAKEIGLFLKLFPNSKLSARYRNKKTHIETSDTPAQAKQFIPTDEDEEALENMEEKLAEKAEPDPKAPKIEEPKQEQAKEEEPPPPTEEPKEPEKPTPPEKDEPEKDWGKFELGIPTKVLITDTDGDELTLKGSASGIFIGWSSEVWLNFGGGVGLEYFTQVLETDEDEYQHLYMETHIKGRFFGLVNLGIGFGGGFTTVAKKDKPNSLEIIPGQGYVISMSTGITYGSFGINYSILNFTGSYREIESSSISERNVEWKGTANIITLEYLY